MFYSKLGAGWDSWVCYTGTLDAYLIWNAGTKIGSLVGQYLGSWHMGQGSVRVVRREQSHHRLPQQHQGTATTP